MKIVFDSIAISGFRSIESGRIDLSNGLKIIEGKIIDGDYGFDSNGAGKSSIAWALCWALYGKVPGLQPGELNPIPRWSKSSFVSVCGNADGEPFIVERLKDSKVNRLELRYRHQSYVGVPKDVQPAISELIGSFELFSASVLFGSRITKFTASTPAEKKRIFDDVLGLEKFRQGKQLAWNRHVESRSAMDGLCRGLQVLNAELLHVKQKLAEFESIETFQRQLAELKSSLLEYEVEDSTDMSEWTDNIKQIVQAEKTKISNHDAWVRDLALKIRTAENGVEVLGRAKEKGNKCPTCGASGAFANIPQIDASIGEHKREISELKQQMERASIDAPDTQTYKDLELCMSTVFTLVSRRNALSEKISALQSVRDNVLQTISRLKNNIKQTEKDIDALKVDSYVAKYCHTALADNGIPSLLVGRFLPALNKFLRNRLDFIYPNASAAFEVSGGRDDFCIGATTPAGVEYASMSDGERARIDLCAALSLQESAASMSLRSYNLRIYDEVFEGLDESGIENVADMLLQEGLSCAVLLITHLPVLKMVAPSKIVVEKRGSGESAKSRVWHGLSVGGGHG